MIPITRAGQIEQIARETARMSYPGSMSRGTKPVVGKGTKSVLEKYFTSAFPLHDLWASSARLVPTFDTWHAEHTAAIAHTLGSQVSTHNDSMAVAAKFLNTFMYQLMKYEPCRPLLTALHLPLDARVFHALSQVRSPSLGHVQHLFRSSPYVIPYPDHVIVQKALLAFMNELNARPSAEFTLNARIELNLLWL